MRKRDPSLNILILVIAAVLALAVGYYVPQTFNRPVEAAKASTPVAKAKSAWAASAPGRIEPLGGEVRIAAPAPGRIAEVLVAANDKVGAGDLLVRLDDEELLARVHAAQTEAAVRKRDRDNESTSNRQAQDRRTAEDAVANAERQVAVNREELDRQIKAQRAGTAKDADVDKVREALGKARDRLEQARPNLRKALSADGLPAPTRPEAALAAARAELSVADAALERTRVRAPSAGTVLQLNAKIGEAAAPSPENVLAIVGNLSALRVRAEFEERDVGKVHVGQAAVVRSDAFGKAFDGKVASLAQGLGPSKLGPRGGPRKPTDVDVLEVLIELTGETPLLPGMRVDVFLKPEPHAQPAAQAKPPGPVTKTN